MLGSEAVLFGGSQGQAVSNEVLQDVTIQPGWKIDLTLPGHPGQVTVSNEARPAHIVKIGALSIWPSQQAQATCGVRAKKKASQSQRQLQHTIHESCYSCTGLAGVVDMLAC